MNAWNALKADTFRQYGRFNFACLLKGFLTRRTFRVIVTMRLCQGTAASSGLLRIWLPFLQVLHRITTHSMAMDLPWRTTVGSGPALTHGWGAVINEGARIGNNVTLFHGVTLGRRDRIASDGKRTTDYPVIEDDVWIGPHAIIVGGITIGHGSRIAGGTFITDNVPPCSVVSGNPSIIVKSGCTPDIENRAPL